jgi:glycosyltransferase involved in cell wall biosynthesis
MKFKVLAIIYPKIAGCQYYRQAHPHEALEKYPGFKVEYKHIFEFLPNEEWLKYDLVHFHKNYVTPEILIKLKVLGVRTMVDFDDYWHVPYNHLSYQHYKRSSQPSCFVEILKQAQYICTTTGLLAKEIQKFNPNVFIFPNCISRNNPNTFTIVIDSETIRFGYLGGACHLPDVELLRGLNNKLSGSGLKYSLNLFGYKQDNVYFDYAKTLTDNGQYTNNLTLYPSLPVPDYLYFYNMVDVSLVPLIPNKFNSLKSELKLVEAGMFGKTVIASNVQPYKPYLQHKKNAFIAETKPDWFKGMKYFIKNPGAASDYGKQLYEDIQKHFNYEKITKYRAEIYQQIIQQGGGTERCNNQHETMPISL